MPIRFRCEYCGQLMGIARRKVGHEVACPRCRKLVIVPEESSLEPASPLPFKKPDAAESGQKSPPLGLLESTNFDVWIKGKRKQREEKKKQAALQGTSAAAELRASDESQTERLGASDAESSSDASIAIEGKTTAPTARPKPLRSRGEIGIWEVQVPLPIVVILVGVFLLIGLCVGWTMANLRNAPSPRDKKANVGEVPPPVKQVKLPISGSVFVDQGSGRVPDAQSAVILLPVDQTPTPKIRSIGLRPDDLATERETTEEQLRRLGGAFTQVNLAGEFSANLDREGQYYLVLISKSAKRGETEKIFRDDLSILKKYFEEPNELLEERKYLLQVVVLKPGVVSNINHQF